MKKKLVLLAIGLVLLAFTTEAAPPLRGLVPMKLADGVTIMPTGESSVALPEMTCCATAAVIGEGGYLQHSGNVRVLAILAAFQDVGFTVNEPVRAFEQYLNGDSQEDLGNMNQLNLASVRQYFETCSHKQFLPQFDIVGPITLPKKMAYYGGTNKNGSDDKFGDFCKDAMEQAKSVVNDWSVYDNDKAGNIELVCVIFAGYGQNQGGGNNTIWAKASRQNLKLNESLRITRFNCSPELFNPAKSDTYDYSQYINGTGVFIHEFSHCLGLPDLYATSESGYVDNQGMESYSIMDYGLYNLNGFAPCPYNAWEQEVMGWTEIEDVSSKMEDGRWQTNNLLPVIEGGKAYKLVNSTNDRDYIVMENVQKRGLNAHGGGHGLLVYHVDYPYATVNMNDSPNNNPGHPSVAVVPAGGLFINSYLRGDGKTYTRNQWLASMESSPFPGTKKVASLTDEMKLPNYCFWDGSTAKSTGFMLNSITEDAESGTVSFMVAPYDPSGIGEVRIQKEDISGIVYDLHGRRMQGKLQPGLYIQNGKKIVVR